MTAKQVNEVFRTIYDRYESMEGITDYEMSVYLNTAQLLVLKDFTHNHRKKRLPAQEPPYVFESTSFDAEDWQPLVMTPFEGKTNTDGRLPIADIIAGFPVDKIYNEVGDVIREERLGVFHMLNGERWSGSQYCELVFRRHNELKKNAFLMASDDHPTVSYEADHLVIRPGGKRTVKIRPMRYPKSMWYLGNLGIEVDPELPDSVMLDVIQRALKLAGIGVRDGELYQFINAEEKNS